MFDLIGELGKFEQTYEQELCAQDNQHARNDDALLRNMNAISIPFVKLAFNLAKSLDLNDSQRIEFAERYLSNPDARPKQVRAKIIEIRGGNGR